MDAQLEGAEPAGLAPRLLIDARHATPDGVGAAHRLLGLSLIERTACAARRSGYGAVHVVAEDAEAANLRRLLSRLADVTVGPAAPEPAVNAARTVCVPGLVVGERSWLDAAARVEVPGDGAVALGAGIVVCGRLVPLPHAVSMAAQAGPTLPGLGPLLRITGRSDLPAAERHLTAALGKGADGFMERHVERPISRRLSRHLAKTSISPNQMTLISAAVGVCAAPFFLSAAPLWQTVGALLFLVHAILDGCDGELARLKFQESRWGGLLDFWGDNVVHVAVFGCMAVGWSRAEGEAWPLALGAAAVGGSLASAGFVYWRVLRPKRVEGPLYVSVATAEAGRLTAMLDSLSRRDFIYLVLVLSLFGKAAWFLALAAAGAPAFFAALLVVAARERTRRRATCR